MKDERREKINKLKTSLKEAQDILTDLVKSLIAETDEAKKEEIQKDIAVRKSFLADTKQELVVVKMNKNNSSFFSWEPHKGFNRQQARNFRRRIK